LILWKNLKRKMGNIMGNSPYKIFISDKIEPICPSVFKEAGYEVLEKSVTSAELLDLVSEYDGLVVRSATKVTSEVLEKGVSGRLKIVGRAGAGLDNIEVVVAEKLGIKVVNTPGLNANAVAELTVAFCLILSRKLFPAMVSIKDQKWDKKNLSGLEISGKSIGLVGVGAVGRLVATKALGLGLSVLAYDPFIKKEDIEAMGARPSSLEEIWAKSDYISLHLPKNKETTNLINGKVLSLCKKTAYLINCARGGLVDEEALFEALSTGKLAGAALDVFENEPPGKSPLLSLPNFVATPHLGASTEEAQLKVAEEVAKLMIKYLNSVSGGKMGKT
jgi:D-3-phosphoglycerate dehydrogenase